MNKNTFLVALSESQKITVGKENIEAQSVPQRVFSSIWAIESKVNNGGFHQYFGNNRARTAAFVVQALEIVGAPRTADICRRAIAVAFPAGLPTTPEAITAAAGKLNAEMLEALFAIDEPSLIAAAPPMNCPSASDGEVARSQRLTMP